MLSCWFDHTWFPVNSSGIFTKANKFQYNLDNITYVQGSFFDVSSTFTPHTFDFIYDGCAIIHFDKSSTSPGFANSGVDKCAKIISNLLKHEKSIFCSASHVSHPNSFELGDMVSAESFLNTFGKYSLCTLSAPYFDLLPVRPCLFHQFNAKRTSLDFSIKVFSDILLLINVDVLRPLITTYLFILTPSAVCNQLYKVLLIGVIRLIQH